MSDKPAQHADTVRHVSGTMRYTGAKFEGPLLCVCDQPEDFCGGADTDPNEPGYCAACAALDGEEHCLRCPFECCWDLQADVADLLHNDGDVSDAAL